MSERVEEIRRQAKKIASDFHEYALGGDPSDTTKQIIKALEGRG